MSLNLQDSVVLITSSNSYLQQGRRSFGTSFVIYQTSSATYLLTCAHVIQDVGGAENILAAGKVATLVASGESKGFDLALLKVEGLLDKPVLPLTLGREAKRFEIAGFYTYNQMGTQMLRRINGYLGKQTTISSIDGSDYIPAWDVHIDDQDDLQPGYSGSPVVDKDSGAVVAVVSDKWNKKGSAIAIEAIKKIWFDMPLSLLNTNKFEFASITSENSYMEVFISYSMKDEKLLKDLEIALGSVDKIQIWHEGKIGAGKNKNVEIEKKLKTANIILLLVSPYFMADYQQKVEVIIAAQRQQTIKATVIPVLLSQVTGWERLRFGNSQLGIIKALPGSGRFATARGWKSKSEAFFTIANELSEQVKAISSDFL